MSVEAYTGKLGVSLYIRATRHRNGAWSATYGCGDYQVTTIRFGGKGAKAAAVAEAMRCIDELTVEQVMQELQG